jgi:hypothetical protein
MQNIMIGSKATPSKPIGYINFSLHEKGVSEKAKRLTSPNNATPHQKGVWAGATAK